MKRAIAALALSLLSAGPAAADTLASQLRAEAQRLLTQVSSVESAARSRPTAKPHPLAPALSSELQRFGLAASRLSSEIDQRGGPADLRCIFRGMAEETGKQLAAASSAKTGADQATALGRLTHMLEDAVEIAPAVGGSSAKAVRAGLIAQCPAAEF